MHDIADIQGVARSVTEVQFVSSHPQPVLVARALVEGDLQFAGQGEEHAAPRPGGTLLHLARMTAAERLSRPRPANRRPLDPERYQHIAVREGSRDLVAGRAETCDLVINDHTVSTVHARMLPVPGSDRTVLTDEGSRNGTKHNGIIVARGTQVVLISGDEIEMGRWVFLYLNAADFHRYLTGGFA